MAEPHQTASGVITESPLVLTDVVTDTGISGHSIVFTYTPAALKPSKDSPGDSACLGRKALLVSRSLR
jgi:mandelate racemase